MAFFWKRSGNDWWFGFVQWRGGGHLRSWPSGNARLSISFVCGYTWRVHDDNTGIRFVGVHASGSARPHPLIFLARLHLWKQSSDDTTVGRLQRERELFFTNVPRLIANCLGAGYGSTFSFMTCAIREAKGLPCVAVKRKKREWWWREIVFVINAGRFRVLRTSKTSAGVHIFLCFCFRGGS